MKQLLRIKNDVYELVSDSNGISQWVSALGVVIGSPFTSRELAIKFAEERVRFYGAFDAGITWKGNAYEN